MQIKKLTIAAVALMIMIGAAGCKTDEPPTKSSMESVWVVKHVYDESGNDQVSRFNFPITAFHLSSDNTVISTAGPLIMYLVYATTNTHRLPPMLIRCLTMPTLTSMVVNFSLMAELWIASRWR